LILNKISPKLKQPKNNKTNPPEPQRQPRKSRPKKKVRKDSLPQSSLVHKPQFKRQRPPQLLQNNSQSNNSTNPKAKKKLLARLALALSTLMVKSFQSET